MVNFVSNSPWNSCQTTLNFPGIIWCSYPAFLPSLLYSGSVFASSLFSLTDSSSIEIHVNLIPSWCLLLRRSQYNKNGTATGIVWEKSLQDWVWKWFIHRQGSILVDRQGMHAYYLEICGPSIAENFTNSNMGHFLHRGNTMAGIKLFKVEKHGSNNALKDSRDSWLLV